MTPLRSRARFLLCLPLLTASCVLDKSATSDDCGESTPCRLQDVGDVPLLTDDPLVSDAGSQLDVLPDGSQLVVPPGDVAPSGDAASPLLAAALFQPSSATLPKSTSACPEFREGSATFAGVSVRLWVGDDGEAQRGPLVFYWHGGRSNVEEALVGLGADAIAEIKRLGGAVAALEESTKQGTTTGSGTWYTGDLAIADEVLACALERGVGIDTARIHAVGFGAGGLQTSWMAYARSSYMASVVSYSGGLTGSARASDASQDASNVVPAMLVHGGLGFDRYLIDFALTSAIMANDIRDNHGFALDCDHGGGHEIPAGIGLSALRFLLDHPYKTRPSPYAQGAPTTIPSYCEID